MDTFILLDLQLNLLGFAFVNLSLDWHSSWKVRDVFLWLLFYGRGRISHYSREARQTVAVLLPVRGIAHY